MCYLVLLSTTSSEDLQRFNTELLQFAAGGGYEGYTGKLRYSQKWYAGSRTGCSCSFRHLGSPELGFEVPQDWFPEEAADIEATLQFIRAVRSLLADGARVDCLDIWHGNEAALLSQAVDLSQLKDEEFRFFENHHFDFTLKMAPEHV